MLVAAIIVIGIVLMFVEMFFLPGVGLVGILGGLIAAGGVALTYSYYGSYYGNMSLLLTGLVALFALGYGFRRLWKLKWSVRESVDSKTNVLEGVDCRPGDKGTAFTVLRPNGKAIINGKRYEVYSLGEYIEKDTPVVVVKITSDKIYVKPEKQ